jgi:hypothetical protein
MLLATRLHKSLEEIQQLSVLELKLWAGLMAFEQEESQKTMNQRKR